MFKQPFDFVFIFIHLLNSSLKTWQNRRARVQGTVSAAVYFHTYRRPDVSRLQDSQMKANYRACIEAKWRQTANGTEQEEGIEKNWEKIKDMMQTAGIQTLGCKKKRIQKEWLSTNTRELIIERSQIKVARKDDQQKRTHYNWYADKSKGVQSLTKSNTSTRFVKTQHHCEKKTTAEQYMKASGRLQEPEHLELTSWKTRTE